MVIWYIFPRFGILKQSKSGKPDAFTRNILKLECLNKKNIIFHVSCFRNGINALIF
jgi:hypothetical protein